MVISALENALSASSGWLNTKAQNALQELSGYTATAVLLNMPRRYVDRRYINPLASYHQQTVNSIVNVLGHSYRRLGRRNQLIVEIADDSAHAELVCFGRDNIKYLLPVGAQIRLTGNFNSQYRKIQATQFEFETYPLRDIAPAKQERYSRFNKILPLYRLPAAVPQVAYFRLVSDLLHAMKDEEQHEHASFLELPHYLRKYLGAPLSMACRRVHLPESERIIGRARTILARHELLTLQLRLHSMRRVNKSEDDQSTPSSASPLDNACRC